MGCCLLTVGRPGPRYQPPSFQHSGGWECGGPQEPGSGPAVPAGAGHRKMAPSGPDAVGSAPRDAVALGNALKVSRAVAPAEDSEASPGHRLHGCAQPPPPITAAAGGSGADMEVQGLGVAPSVGSERNCGPTRGEEGVRGEAKSVSERGYRCPLLTPSRAGDVQSHPCSIPGFTHVTQGWVSWVPGFTAPQRDAASGQLIEPLTEIPCPSRRVSPEGRALRREAFQTPFSA